MAVAVAHGGSQCKEGSADGDLMGGKVNVSLRTLLTAGSCKSTE